MMLADDTALPQLQLRDILVAGIKPGILMEINEMAESLAELRQAYNFSDKEIIDLIKYHEASINAKPQLKKRK